MKWIYRNNFDNAIYYRNYVFTKNKDTETDYPMPVNLGLICIQEGTMPDPILFQDNILVKANSQKEINISSPNISYNINLSIFVDTENTIKCQFNSKDNKSFLIRSKSINNIMSWEMCSKIIFINTSNNDVFIDITALEVVS